MTSPFSYFGSMESPATSKAMVSSEIGKGISTSPRPSGGTCSCSGSIEAPAPTRPMIGTEFNSRYSIMGVISEALIRRSPDRISETAPGRTPIACARPPLVLPGFPSPRSIMATSSMAAISSNFRNHSNSDYQKSSLTLISEYPKLVRLGGISFDLKPRPAQRQTIMQATNWAPEHCDALREYHTKGMSYSKIAEAINAKFGTVYSRNAAIGRGKRMGLAGPEQPRESPRVPPTTTPPRPRRSRERRAAEPVQPKPAPVCVEPVKLR